jgi:hypothetical protein
MPMVVRERRSVTPSPLPVEAPVPEAA